MELNDFEKVVLSRILTELLNKSKWDKDVCGYTSLGGYKPKDNFMLVLDKKEYRTAQDILNKKL